MKRCLLALVLLVCLLISGCRAEPSPLVMTFFDAGKADAILLQTEGRALLIDTGLSDNASVLIASLRERGVRGLDALIVTHFDKDHVGGASDVLRAFPVGHVFEPDASKNSDAYDAYRAALSELKITPNRLTDDVTFDFGRAVFVVSPAHDPNFDRDRSNNLSLVTSVAFGDCRALFLGDCEDERLTQLLADGQLACQVLKYPHHGAYSPLAEPLIRATNPSIAVIPCSDDQPEDERVLALLQAAGCAVYPTRQGAVTLTCDGQTVAVS